MIARVVLVAAIALGPAACREPGPFRCARGEDCVGSEGAGRCEANGFCSVDDAICTGSARRYGPFSGDLSNVCVGMEPRCTAGPCAPEDVVWQNGVNVRIDGPSVTKTAGHDDGLADGGAHSKQRFEDADGYLEFTKPDDARDVYVGLTDDTSGAVDPPRPFSFQFFPPYVEVRELGAYRADTTYAPGDRFRIAIEGGVVRYYKGSTRIHESAGVPTFPMVANVTLALIGSGITDAVIAP